jgi:RNAse (barnase) inhibitor barstar
MAWEVAVILSAECNESTVASLATYMPIWIADTFANRPFVTTARRTAGDLWSPEPACTTFRVYDEFDSVDNFIEVVETIVLHHPYLAKLNLLGLEDSQKLRSHMLTLGFLPAIATWDATIAFRKPITSHSDVPRLTLDARKWHSSEDVYDALFSALGSPAWHGKNFNALHDSIVTGGINRVEVPYVLNIQGVRSAKSEAHLFIKDLFDLISKFEEQGCPVAIQIEN